MDIDHTKYWSAKTCFAISAARISTDGKTIGKNIDISISIWCTETKSSPSHICLVEVNLEVGISVPPKLLPKASWYFLWILHRCLLVDGSHRIIYPTSVVLANRQFCWIMKVWKIFVSEPKYICKSEPTSDADLTFFSSGWMSKQNIVGLWWRGWFYVLCKEFLPKLNI